MTPSWRARGADLLVLAGTIILFGGCIASSFHSARTLEPGQVSLSGGYMHAINIERGDQEPLRFGTLEARVSPLRRMDFGVQHTFDFITGSEGQYNTVWGDFRYQITNASNEPYTPILTAGLMKGYVYHEDAQLHLTSIPIVLSLPINETVTPTVMYRHEFISDGFLPEEDEWSHPRRFFSVGAEIALAKPDSRQWIPKIGVSIGTFNSIGGDGGDSGLTLNVGFTFDSPHR
jgi:hypothetical protein